MNKFAGFLFKCSLAAVISIAVLSLFSLIYYNPPVATQQPDGITNYKYRENTKWSFMLEGSGYGKTDYMGYNNAYPGDYSQPDIVFMGSSHLEALQVPQEDNCVYLLNEKFDKDSLTHNDFKCLNLGISANAFEVSLSNFEYVVEKYKSAKYIVVETSDVEFSSSMLDDIAQGKFHAPEGEKGILHKMLQKIPYLRLIYKKINEVNAAKVGDIAASVDSDTDDDISIYIDKMDTLLSKISKKAFENGIQPVILFHQQFLEDSGRNIITANSPEYTDAFKECCENNNIKLIDVTNAMIDSYHKNYDVSYGFSNTAPGEGHLNKNGHRIIAQELYKTINEMEENK